MTTFSKKIGGVLLVSGTTIGAGMLALPVSTGMAGFIPSVMLLIAYWCYMTYTAFLMLEINLWLKEGHNFMSMIKVTLGKGGQVVGWVLYLFLLYLLVTAYIAGCGPIFIDAIQPFIDVALPEWVGSIPLLVIFGFFVYKGMKYVDGINRVLMVGLVMGYLAMVAFTFPYIELHKLNYSHWKFMIMGVSVIATSFGFHIIIPSLVTYLERDVRAIKKVILIGSIIPLLFYIVWEVIALGIIPVSGPNGLKEGFLEGDNGAHLLTEFLGNPAIILLARLFSFFAIVSSFMGVSLSLFDFLSDGLKIKKTRLGRLLLYFLAFIPPLLIALYDPRAFLSALEYAGAFGVVTLLGLFPALMAWSGRYYKNFSSELSLPTWGGKKALVVVMCISLFIIAIEIAIKTKFIQLLPL